MDLAVPVEEFTYMPGEQPAIKTLGGNATECAAPKEVVVSPATHNVGPSLHLYRRSV